MNVYLWRCLILLIPSFASMLFGLIRVFPKTNGLYFRMGTIGMACLFAGYLSSFTTYITGMSISGIVNVSVLGSIGFSLFIMTQNADSVSSVMYKQVKQDGINRLFPFAAPVIIFLIFAVFEINTYVTTYEHDFSYWFGTVGMVGLGAVLSAIASFYTLRYSLSTDEEFGLVSCLRPYNITLTIFLILLIPERFIREMTAVTVAGNIGILIYYIILAAGILVVLPIMERGRAQFLTSL